MKDPNTSIEHAIRMVLDGEVIIISGKRHEVEIDSLCIHGDEPTAIAVAGAVRKGLEDAGVRIVTLPEMTLT